MGTENAVFVENAIFSATGMPLLPTTALNMFSATIRWMTAWTKLRLSTLMVLNSSSRKQELRDIWEYHKERKLGSQLCRHMDQGGDGVIYDNQVFDCSNGILLSNIHNRGRGV